MTICICQHEERHHEAGKCDKIGCYCELFRPDMEDYTDIKFGPIEESPIEGYSEEEIDRWMGRRYQEQADQLAALQAENDGLREALTDLLAWANIQDHHSAQAVSIRGRAWVALNRTPIQEAQFVPPPNDEDFMDM